MGFVDNIIAKCKFFTGTINILIPPVFMFILLFRFGNRRRVLCRKPPVFQQVSLPNKRQFKRAPRGMPSRSFLKVAKLTASVAAILQERPHAREIGRGHWSPGARRS